MGFSATELAKFNAAGKALAGAVKISLEEWALGEAGLILSKTAARITVPSLNRVELRERRRTLRELGFTGGKANEDATISISAGVRGPYLSVWLRKKNAGHGKTSWRRTHDANFIPVSGVRGQGTGDHYKKGDWIDLQEAIDLASRTLAKAIPMAIAARGLARQSLIQIGDALGIRLETVRGGPFTGEGIAQARSAVASNGRYYVNGTGTVSRTPTSFLLEGVDTYPKIQEARMDLAFMAAFSERLMTAKRTLSDNLLRSTSATLRAFPYVSLN